MIQKYAIFAILVLVGSCHAAGDEVKPGTASPPSPTPILNTNTPAPQPKAILTNSTVSVATPAPSPKPCVCDAPFSRVENGKEVEICPECKCKYENRNSTLIKVVVILVIWIISILVIYMLFLMCLDPLLNKRAKSNYQEHTNEDDDTTSVTPPMSPPNMGQELSARANVLNRVGHQQTKWKKQVREQRRNIYDRRTMLN